MLSAHYSALERFFPRYRPGSNESEITLLENVDNALFFAFHSKRLLSEQLLDVLLLPHSMMNRIAIRNLRVGLVWRKQGSFKTFFN